jgi:hypothetical protein
MEKILKKCKDVISMNDEEINNFIEEISELDITDIKKIIIEILDSVKYNEFFNDDEKISPIIKFSCNEKISPIIEQLSEEYNGIL